MKPPTLSIATVMASILILALHLAASRASDSVFNAWRIPLPEQSLGILSMSALLMIAAFLIFRDLIHNRRTSPFLPGFLLSGSFAIFLYVCIFLVSPYDGFIIPSYFELVFDLLPASLDNLNPRIGELVFTTLIALLVLIPLLSLALLGGWLSSKLRLRLALDPPPTDPSLPQDDPTPLVSMPRAISLSTVMGAVPILALNLWASKSFYTFGSIFADHALGIFSMTSLLSIAAFLIVRDLLRTRHSGTFLPGFLLFGASALFLYVACFLASPEWVSSYVQNVLFPLGSLTDSLDPAVFSAVWTTILAFGLLIPQLPLALLGGWLSCKFKLRLIRDPSHTDVQFS